jgi:hypothetical protein
MIPAYLDQLASTLRFDRALSRCVVQEVEDHLREAIAADPAPDRLEAERRAIMNFGEPQLLAAQFAAVSLARRTRRLGIAVVLAIIAVLAAMKARVAWYAALQWSVSDDARPLAAIVLTIDRFAFWLAAAVGIGALLYAGRHRVASAPGPEYRRQMRRARLLCGCAAASLAVSVISDGVLTALQLGTELRAESAVPIISMVIEIACAGAVIALILDAARRAGAMEALRSTGPQTTPRGDQRTA